MLETFKLFINFRYAVKLEKKKWVQIFNKWFSRVRLEKLSFRCQHQV